MAEWSNATVLKTVIPRDRNRGFESLSLLHLVTHHPGTNMHYVYIIKSQRYPQRTYIGNTVNLEQRLKSHNNGICTHTKPYLPWKVVVFIGFENKYYWSVTRKYCIPAKLVKPGKNVIAVRVFECFGSGGLVAKPLSLGCPRAVDTPEWK